MDTRAYWRRVREVESQLPAGESVTLISTADTLCGRVGGVVSEAPRSLAAELIANGTHELATPDQIAACRERVQRESERAAVVARAGLTAEIRIPGKENA